MGEQTVIDTTPKVGSQTTTPAVEPAPTTVDPAAELARIRQENAELAKRLADKDAHITELSTEKATLESRLTGFQVVSSINAERETEEAQPDPAPEGSTEPAKPKARGGVDVSAFPHVRPEDIPEIIERTNFANEMRKENKDMIDADLEPSITLRADQLMRTGKSFKEAVATSVKEHRERFNKIKAPAAPSTPTPPAGARGEDGAPSSIEPKPKVSEEDEAAERARLKKLRGL